MSATVEITDFDCYVPPEITAETGDFDLEAFFRAKLVDMELTVNFRGVSIDLNSVALRNFVTLGKDGRVQVQKKTLAQRISAWGETYDEHNTGFIFDSFVDGPVPIAFLKVDYTLDQAALAALLEPQLHMRRASASMRPSCARNLTASRSRSETPTSRSTSRTST